jgi:hypothetical protein
MKQRVEYYVKMTSSKPKTEAKINISANLVMRKKKQHSFRLKKCNKNNKVY